MCKQFPFRNVCGLLTVICFWESKDTLCTTPVLSPPDYLHHSDYYHQVTMKSIHYDYYFFLQCLNNVPTIYYIPSGQSPSLTQHFFFFSWSKSCFTWICHNEEKKRQSRSFCLIPTLGLLLCWYQCYWSESERALLLVLSSWKIMSIVLKILNNIFQ